MMTRNVNAMERSGIELPHHLVLEGRSRLAVSGVEEVESFDEGLVVLYTSKGILLIRGSGLSIDRLSIDKGELSVEGEVDALEYENRQQKGGGFWSRLLK